MMYQTSNFKSQVAGGGGQKKYYTTIITHYSAVAKTKTLPFSPSLLNNNKFKPSKS